MKNKNKILPLLLTLALCFTLCLVFASCQKNHYKVTFRWNNGDPDTVADVEEGKTPEVPSAPDRFGYDFGGFYTDKELTTPADPANAPVNGDVIYYAGWKSHTSVRVSFDTNGGSAVADTVLDNGALLDKSSIPATAKDGYTFRGWYTDAAGHFLFDFTAAPRADITLYAGWTLNSGMGEFVIIVGGREVGRIAFPAGKPTAPAMEGEEKYLWFEDNEHTTPFDFSLPVSSSQRIYGVAYTEGLVIKNGTVLGYEGTASTVTVPDVWEGVTVRAVAASAFASDTALRRLNLPDTITSVGENAFYGCTKLTAVNLTKACTSLGKFAFYDCAKLTTVGDISSLTAIADSVFLGCARLQSVTFSDALLSIGSYAFSGCKALKTLTLSDGISSIGEYAFSGCTSVTELHIPASLSSLGAGALSDLTSLQKLTVSANNDTAFYRVIDNNLYGNSGKKLLLYVGYGKKEQTVNLPAGVTTIAAYAFSGNENITELSFTDTKITLESGALAGMKGLRKLTIPALSGEADYLAYYFGAKSAVDNGSAGIYSPVSLAEVTIVKSPTALADYAFYGFGALRTIRGLDDLQSIGKYAFAHTAIADVNIPTRLTGIGENAFFGCTNISSFVVSADNAAYTAFDHCLYNKQLTVLYMVPQAKTEIAFPDTLTTIAAGAFYKSNVVRVTLPQSLKTIAQGAFSGVLRLEELSVPFIGGSRTENNYMLYIFGGSVSKTLQTDGTYSYSSGNTSCTPPTLKKLIITSDVSEIPDFGFAYLNGMEEVVLPGTLKKIGAYAYCRTGFVTMVIPDTVESIGAFAFAAMNELTSVTVPGSVGENLGEGLFYSCSDLETVIFREGVKKIPDSAFASSSIGEDDETGEKHYSSSLKYIRIPASVEHIGEMAFAYAGTYYIGAHGSRYENLEFVLADGSLLRSVGRAAFYRSSISSLNLPACFETVGEMAFFGCTKLATVTFGSKTDGSELRTIGGAAFAFCTGLQKMTIYKTVASLSDVPTAELYTTSSTTGTYSYNIFVGANVPEIYVCGAEYYRTAENWNEYDTKVFALAD